jgi:HAD superfamily hydrolase (TIGR01509 family)
MAPVEMVWFDLDDTLYDHSYSVARAMERIRAEYPAFSGHQPHELAVLYNQALNEVYLEYLRGNIDFAEMRRRKLHRFFHAAGIPEPGAPDNAEFHRVYDEAYCVERRATPGSIEAVRHLQERGIGVAVLTNGTQRIQEEKLRIIGLTSLLPCLLTSDKAGATKPDPEIFEWALRQSKCAAHCVLMIGDNLQNDVEGALRAGIRAAHYSPSSAERTVVTQAGTAPVISDWVQVPDLLENGAATHAKAGHRFGA